ncbi:hypothetical protein J4E90_009600 [Alternaria incomplexa]|uniref:uncharacterized protein n=1 Tax=Alternaria incomplexa TaxID=1187928 RepID=UPI00221F1E38|nr:uncharacterized protein J4E90_009600 [Alternaria incomplexa]KAI4907571.1 hypothetical protein J4E90_009600 [Alternaria incomplexa]
MAQVTKAEATAAKQLNSPLLRLPAELRNLIYRYALGDRTLILSTIDDETLRLYQRDIPAFALLALCKQIHSETVLLPYSLNTFDIDCCFTFKCLVATIPRTHVQAIKKLDLRTLAIWGESNYETCMRLKVFSALEEVTFSYAGSTDTLWHRDCEERWAEAVKMLREKMPWVATSMRDLRDEILRDDALDFAA